MNLFNLITVIIYIHFIQWSSTEIKLTKVNWIEVWTNETEWMNAAGHSALSSIQSPFISLINAERMKCGLNWSESGPVPLRSCGTKSINLSFLSLKELDWFDCSCLLPCARRYSALRLLYVRLPLPSSFTYSSWLRKHPSLLTVHFTFIKLN